MVPASLEGGSRGSERSDSERLEDCKLRWDMFAFGGECSSESRKNWIRSRFSVDRCKKEEDILMGAEGLAESCNVGKRGQTRLHRTPATVHKR